MHHDETEEVRESSPEKGSRLSLQEFIALYDNFYSMVVKFFLDRNYSREDASDLAQETFFRAYKGWSQFRRDAKPKNWLMKIAANIFIDEVKKKYSVNLHNGQRVRIDSLEEVDHIDTSSLNQVDSIINEETKERLVYAISSLPPRMRHCISLRVIQQLKYSEIALIMKSNPNTIKSLLYQARKKLKGLIIESERSD